MTDSNNSPFSTLHSPLPKGYKQTEVGVIPEDWSIQSLGDLGEPVIGLTYTPSDVRDNGYLVLRASNIQRGQLCFEDNVFVSGPVPDRVIVKNNDILICVRNGSRDLIGKCALITNPEPNWAFGAFMSVLRSDIGAFLIWQFQGQTIQKQIKGHLGATINQITNRSLRSFLCPLPPTKAEQEAIADALSDADALIASLEQLIAKKRCIKQGAMQELLTGKRRLPSFSGDWEEKTLGETTECLDSVRVPLNESQRRQIAGDIPYCGANGVLDYVNDYVIDDDIILMAEDGGYFDEYETRPIAYRMIGKCWVNNHAHVLKSLSGYDQSFLFYSLVHKNILPFLASGTRAKLNKSELNKITVCLPPEKTEQTAIATVLSEMDVEIDALETKLAKARLLKHGMMQELLTGKTRLING